MLGGLLALAAPVIIRTPGLLMPVKPVFIPAIEGTITGGFGVTMTGAELNARNEAFYAGTFSDVPVDIEGWVRGRHELAWAIRERLKEYGGHSDKFYADYTRGIARQVEEWEGKTPYPLIRIEDLRCV